ncbi:Porphobilinogen deaminase (modular protein) [Candidatus Zixiibacteriota bacterium]|nr:Porphobilinogen deaminase (modular protein) [candidate division Zixibacteria bacterium]
MLFTIGSRGSELALYQANLIKSYLSNMGIDVDIKIIKTVGDKIDNLSFDKIEGKGFFTKELEEALLSREIDLAVHSLKDLSTTMPEGLKVGAYCNPEDPSELLLINPVKYEPSQRLFLKVGAVIGTSSVRRQAQIAHYRPDLKIEPLRGNVPTRVRKLREGKYDSILIARAGVDRLKLDTEGLVRIVLDRQDFIPAPGQGILTIEIRDNDPNVEEIVSRLNEAEAETTAILERGLLARFQGGCQLPLAVTSQRRNGGSYLKAFLGIKDGERWSEPAMFSGFGENIEELIEKAYRELNRISIESKHKKKVLITRSEEEGGVFFMAYRSVLTPVFYPIFEIAASYDKDKAREIVEGLSNFDWLIFTSKNSVRIFKDILEGSGTKLDSRLKIASVGQKTSDLIKSLGWRVEFIPQQEDSAGMLKELPRILGSGEVSILLPQGEEAPAHLEKGLQVEGYKVTRFNIYRTAPTSEAMLPRIEPDEIDFFIFTSPLSVEYFEKLGHVLPSRSWVATIGNPTAESLTAHYRQPDFIPPKADIGAIVQKIMEQI